MASRPEKWLGADMIIMKSLVWAPSSGQRPGLGNENPGSYRSRTVGALALLDDDEAGIVVGAGAAAGIVSPPPDKGGLTDL